MAHDPDRAKDDEADDQDAEGQRQHVVGVVRPGGDVQEEDDVDADLGNGKRDQQDRDGRLPDDAA